jgi:hypothetical protein
MNYSGYQMPVIPDAGCQLPEAGGTIRKMLVFLESAKVFCFSLPLLKPQV